MSGRGFYGHMEWLRGIAEELHSGARHGLSTKDGLALISLLVKSLNELSALDMKLTHIVDQAEARREARVEALMRAAQRVCLAHGQMECDQPGCMVPM